MFFVIVACAAKQYVLTEKGTTLFVCKGKKDPQVRLKVDLSWTEIELHTWCLAAEDIKTQKRLCFQFHQKGSMRTHGQNISSRFCGSCPSFRCCGGRKLGQVPKICLMHCSSLCFRTAQLVSLQDGGDNHSFDISVVCPCGKVALVSTPQSIKSRFSASRCPFRFWNGSCARVKFCYCIVLHCRDRHNVQQTWQRLGVKGPKSSSFVFGNLSEILKKVGLTGIYCFLKWLDFPHSEQRSEWMHELFCDREAMECFLNGPKFMGKYLGKLSPWMQSSVYSKRSLRKSQFFTVCVLFSKGKETC